MAIAWFTDINLVMGFIQRITGVSTVVLGAKWKASGRTMHAEMLLAPSSSMQNACLLVYPHGTNSFPDQPLFSLVYTILPVMNIERRRTQIFSVMLVE